jgi:NitT/TauT family transport system substrate-binding protein
METNIEKGIWKKYLGIAVVLVLVAGLFITFNNKSVNNTATVANSGALETTKVRVGDWPAVHGLPFYVAMEKGYFTDAGLDVERVKFEAPNQVIDALVSGQVDITAPSGALGITGIVNYKNPGKLKIYAISGGTAGNSGADFVLPVNSTLKSLSDLKGKKLGIPAGTIQWRTIAREIMSQNGLDIDKDLTIVEIAPALQVQALASGQIDALLAVEPVPTTAVGKNVGKMWITDPTVKYISDPSWLGAGIVNVQFAEKNPKTTAKVIEIITKTIEEINKNPDQYRQYLKNYTSLTDQLINKVPLVTIRVCGQINVQEKNSIQKFFDIFTKNKVVDGKISVDDVLFCK